MNWKHEIMLVLLMNIKPPNSLLLSNHLWLNKVDSNLWISQAQSFLNLIFINLIFDYLWDVFPFPHGDFLSFLHGDVLILHGDFVSFPNDYDLRFSHDGFFSFPHGGVLPLPYDYYFYRHYDDRDLSFHHQLKCLFNSAIIEWKTLLCPLFILFFEGLPYQWIVSKLYNIHIQLIKVSISTLKTLRYFFPYHTSESYWKLNIISWVCIKQ
jgi:hypothetical protein